MTTKHQLFVSMGNDFSKALQFSDHIAYTFGDAIKLVSTGMNEGEFGSYIEFNDFRCIPALMEIANIWNK